MSSTDHVPDVSVPDDTREWIWDPVTGTYWWWDGAAYAARARWNGSSWDFGPPQPAQTQPRKRSIRWWLWGPLIALGVVISVGLGYAFHEVCCTHDLLEENFESANGRFQTGVRDDYAADLHEGTYRITSTTSSPSSPAISFAWLSRPAGAVRSEVTVVEPGAGQVGVACLVAGGSTMAGYRFVIGDGNAALIDLDRDAVVRQISHRGIQTDERIGIRCGFGTLEGLIDGTVVVSATYERGRHNFDRVALSFEPAAEGDSVRFDDVDAHLP